MSDETKRGKTPVKVEDGLKTEVRVPRSIGDTRRLKT